jgi:hypothetical protein
LNPRFEGLVLPYVSGRRVWADAYVRARELGTNLFTLNSNNFFVISVVKFVEIVIAITVIITVVTITFVSVTRVGL